MIVFDTKASNTGVYRGAVTLLELELNRKVIWAACRHHIPELEIRNVWSMLFGDNYGPDYKHFVDFKDVWPNLNLNGPIKYLVVRSPWLKEQKQKVIKFLSNILTHTDSSKELIGSRGDYRQMAELTLKILSVDPPRGFRFEKIKLLVVQDRFQLSYFQPKCLCCKTSLITALTTSRVSIEWLGTTPSSMYLIFCLVQLELMLQLMTWSTTKTFYSTRKLMQRSQIQL